jgi:Glycosyl hydrolase catalytic core
VSKKSVRGIALIAAAGVAVVGLAVPAAGAVPGKSHRATKPEVAKKPKAQRSGKLLIGLNDEPDVLYGDPALAFQTLHALRTQVVRVNLYWGGNKWAVANSRPTDPTDPGDPAYRWALYDRLVRYAATYHIQVLFSIVYTPGWANGGKARTVAPTAMQDLTDFAFAAAERYSGFWIPPKWQEDTTLAPSGTPLPLVNLWTAWNEPNNPGWLSPQYKRVGGKWRIDSAVKYAQICNSVYAGVHAVTISPARGAPPGEQVACGVTDPRGNDAPKARRSSVDPLSFLTAARNAGMNSFDAYAHNPYASSGKEAPKFVPKGKNKRRIQIGNINVLLNLIKKYYGPKPLWITEYAYQTNPPDKTVFGTSWHNQALYLKQAVAIARKNPRIDMFVWFLVRDEAKLGGWQSGLETVSGQKKPAWNAFRSLPRG